MVLWSTVAIDLFPHAGKKPKQTMHWFQTSALTIQKWKDKKTLLQRMQLHTDSIFAKHDIPVVVGVTVDHNWMGMNFSDLQSSIDLYTLPLGQDIHSLLDL